MVYLQYILKLIKRFVNLDSFELHALVYNTNAVLDCEQNLTQNHTTGVPHLIMYEFNKIMNISTIIQEIYE